MMPLQEIMRMYGVDPHTIRHNADRLDWWIIGVPSIVDGRGGGRIGYLCVRVVLPLDKIQQPHEIARCTGAALEDNMTKVRYYFKPLLGG
jgi:hypothetical protein